MTALHWLGGLIALLLLAGFIVFAFRQGMRVRPSGKAHDAGVGAGWTAGGEGIGGESHGGGDAGHS
jgi:hypothetical protein